MKRMGTADMPLHGGKVPFWLAQRMELLGGAIAEVIIEEYGTDEFFGRISNPDWFQSLGCVLGMDWHSSGITTSVMGALQRAFSRKHAHLGIRICGGRGAHSRQTPMQLIEYSEKNGLDGQMLARHSRLCAKVDNTAIQDGFNIYLHCFMVDTRGKWAVIQQGMDSKSGMARRYHWLSSVIKDFTTEPHSAITGIPKGTILNLTDRNANSTKEGLIFLSRENPDYLKKEIHRLVMPRHHEVFSKDIDLKRLGAVLSVAYEQQPKGFEDLLLLQGLGPRTLQSLVLVSEVIHGTPSRFRDPARFSFAHGGKDGHPFPVPTRIYDQTISYMNSIVSKARIDQTDKKLALRNLHNLASRLEKNIIPEPERFNDIINNERKNSANWKGMTAKGPVQGPSQLELFH